MSLDPQVRAYLAAVAAADLPPLHTLTPAEGREEAHRAPAAHGCAPAADPAR